MKSTRTGSLTSNSHGVEPDWSSPTPVSPTVDPQQVDRLRNQIRKLETASRAKDACAISTGCAGLDALLPDRGLVTGTITEWLAASAGCGAELLSLLAAREAARRGGALVIIDPHHRFCPVAAAAWGISLEHLIVLRDARPAASPAVSAAVDSSLLWAIDQSLRCPAVAAVWGRPGPVSERWQRRFQLSAEQSGAMGLFVRPLNAKGHPGWSEVQWQVGSPVARGSRPCRPAVNLSNQRKAQQADPAGAAFDRYLSVRLLRVRSGHVATPNPLTLKIDFTTGKAEPVTRTHERLPPSAPGTGVHFVPLAAQLAHPKAGRRRQRA